MTPSPVGEVRVAAVGDLMLGDSAICVGFGFHSRYPGAAATRPLAPLRDAFAGADVVLGNLECMLTPRGLGGTRYRADQMRGDPAYAEVLRATGFTALSVANNHAMQHGAAAFAETVGLLRAAGIAVAGVRGHDGWACEPVVQRLAGGSTVGILAYCWRPRQYHRDEPPFAEGDAAAAVADVARLRTTVDHVVVMLHWGEEFLSSPSVTEVADAHRLIDAGASLVLGHHPHVTRPVERLPAGLICYSLGNAAADMLWQDELRNGQLLRCTLAAGGVRDVVLQRTRIGDDYTTHVVGVLEREDALVPLEADAYQAAVAAGLARQRRAAYGYALRNGWRYPPAVLGELAVTTARNKVTALRARGGASGGMKR